MSHSLTNRVWSIRGLTPSQKIVLLCYAAHHNHKHAESICWPKRETVMEETGMSQASFYRRRAELVEAGYLVPVPVDHAVIAAHAEALWQAQGWKLSVDEAWRICPQPILNLRTNHSQSEKNNSQSENAYKERTGIEPELEPEVHPSVTEIVDQPPLDFEPDTPERERTDPTPERTQRFQKFWGPVEGFLRKQVVEDVFLRRFAGIELVDLRSDFVVLRAPPWVIEYHGDANAFAQSMEAVIDESGTGLRRGRRVRLEDT